MKLDEFVDLLQSDQLPKGLSEELIILWYDGKGMWDKAHDIAQDLQGKNGALLHGYLHRVEGDVWNAQYWYRRAGEELPTVPLRDEWEALVTGFLGDT